MWTKGKDGLEDMLIVPGCTPVQAPGNSLEECAENANRICHCVNNFDDLVEACELALESLNGTNIMGELCNPKEVEMLESALQKAKD